MLLKNRYIYDQLTLKEAAEQIGVPFRTCINWKNAAKRDGDDWDRVRDLHYVSEEATKNRLMRLAARFFRRVEVVMERLENEDSEATVGDEISQLTSLADTLIKIANSIRNQSEQVDRLNVALEVVRKVVAYVGQHHPEHAQVMAEILEPLATELAKEYG